MLDTLELLVDDVVAIMLRVGIILVTLSVVVIFTVDLTAVVEVLTVEVMIVLLGGLPIITTPASPLPIELVATTENV